MFNHSLSTFARGRAKTQVWGILLTVVIPYFYPIKTINKALFWEGNHRTHSDLGTNNLVPHVLITIWLQVLEQALFRVQKPKTEEVATSKK